MASKRPNFLIIVADGEHLHWRNRERTTVANCTFCFKTSATVTLAHLAARFELLTWTSWLLMERDSPIVSSDSPRRSHPGRVLPQSDSYARLYRCGL